MRNPRSLALLGLALFTSSAYAQQKVQWDSKYNIPVAPTGLAHRPLPDHPMLFDTAEGQNIRVGVVTKALEYPWSMAFLPDGSMLVTERPGRLRIIKNGVLDPKPVAGAPASYWAAESGAPGAVHGYMDIALHPKFAQNHLVYLTYTKPLDGGKRTTAIARGRWEGGALKDVKDIFTLDEGSTSRIAFGSDGMLYMSTTGKDPQDPNTLGGKVLRLRDDGSVPPDNPFVGQAGHRPEVYTLGHRSALGLAVNPATGEMWENENGPNGGDEINVLKPGRNYGWPLVSYGRTYQGPWQVCASRARGLRSASGNLDPRDRGLRHDLLHRRQVSEMEGRRFRRLASYRRDSGHRPSGAHPVQRQDGGTAARGFAERVEAAHSRCSPRPGWLVVPAHGRERRSGVAHRAGEVAGR